MRARDIWGAREQVVREGQHSPLMLRCECEGRVRQGGAHRVEVHEPAQALLAVGEQREAQRGLQRMVVLLPVRARAALRSGCPPGPSVCCLHGLRPPSPGRGQLRLQVAEYGVGDVLCAVGWPVCGVAPVTLRPAAHEAGLKLQVKPHLRRQPGCARRRRAFAASSAVLALPCPATGCALAAK